MVKKLRTYRSYSSSTRSRRSKTSCGARGANPPSVGVRPSVSALDAPRVAPLAVSGATSTEPCETPGTRTAWLRVPALGPAPGATSTPSAAPHSLQNLAVSALAVPHCPHLFIVATPAVDGG